MLATLSTHSRTDGGRGFAECGSESSTRQYSSSDADDWRCHASGSGRRRSDGGVKRDARLAVRIRFVQTPFSQTHPSHYQRSVAGRKAHPFKLRRWKSCCSRSKQNRPETVNYGRQNAARRSRSAGSVNWKTAPRGVPELAHSLPPWASTIERQIDSPIPNPLVLVV